MASRKTDFNTEDIMSSLLGMSEQDKKEEETSVVPSAEISAGDKAKEEDTGRETAFEKGPEDKKEETVPVPLEIPEASLPFSRAEDAREYIPIDPVRLHRRDEKEMKVPVSFSLSRSMAEQLKQIAYIDRVSSSEIVASLIQGFINTHQAELLEYRAIMQRRKS